MNDEELKDFLGPVAWEKYGRISELEKGRVQKWCAEVAAMSDAELVRATASQVTGEAVLSSRGVYSTYDDILTTVCYQESGRRHVKAGHTEECRGDTLYSKGHSRAVREAGFTASDPYPCDCGAVS